MKHLKKVLALVVAMVMVLGTMSTAFAATTIVPEGLTADTQISVAGLDAADTVTLYQLLEYKNNAENTSAGWVLTAPFANDAACKAVLKKINETTTGAYTLTKDDVKAFTDVINDGADAAIVSGGANNNGTYTATVNPGMYMALVKPAVAGTLYNPIIVSADYFQNSPDTSSIVASSGVYVGGDTGFAKKETLKVEKTQDDPQDETDNSLDAGDTVEFTVKTTIPTYAEVYKDPSFTVTDTMSTGLELKTGTIKVYEEDGTTLITELNNTTVITEKGTAGWTVDVPSAYIKGLEAPKPIVIKYSAELTPEAFTSVTEEVNDVKVEFSNNPNDSTDKGTVKDKTRTYTFSIDGSLLGGSNGEPTSELVKVAVDGNGNPIEQSTSTNETYEHALAGAIFGLFKTEAAATAYTGDGKTTLTSAEAATAGLYTNKEFNGFVTTDTNGYMEINGLDEGIYYLKELSAPTGFIKDQKVHKIEITATYGTETITEDGYTYTLPVLESYTIKVDDKDTTTYSMKLDSSDITTSKIVEASNSLLNNTKGVELPSTGGMGTTIFYIVGAILVLGAGVVLVTRRRMSVN